MPELLDGPDAAAVTLADTVKVHRPAPHGAAVSGKSSGWSRRTNHDGRLGEGPPGHKALFPTADDDRAQHMRVTRSRARCA